MSISIAMQMANGTSSGQNSVVGLSRAEMLLAQRRGYHEQSINGRNHVFPVKDQITTDILNGVSAQIEGASSDIFDKAYEGVYFDDDRRNAYYRFYMGKTRQDFKMNQMEFMEKDADVLDYLKKTHSDVSSKILVIPANNGQRNHLPRFFGTNYVERTWKSNELKVTQATILHAISTGSAAAGSTSIPAAQIGKSTTFFLEYAANSPLTDCKSCYCQDNTNTSCGLGVRQAIHHKVNKKPVSVSALGVGQSFSQANDNAALGWIKDIKHGQSFTSGATTYLGALVTVEWGYGKQQPTCDVNGNSTGYTVGMPKAMEVGDSIYYSNQYVPLGDCDIQVCCGGCMNREVEERECDYMESRTWCAYQTDLRSDTFNNDLIGLTSVNETMQRAIRRTFLEQEEFNANYETVFARSNMDWGTPFSVDTANPNEVAYSSCLSTPPTRTSFVNHMESPHTTKMSICFEKLGSICEEQYMSYMLSLYFNQIQGEDMTIVGDIDSVKLYQSQTQNANANIQFAGDHKNPDTIEMLRKLLANTSGLQQGSFSGQLPTPNGVNLFMQGDKGMTSVTMYGKTMKAIHDTILTKMYPGRLFIHNANRRHKFTASKIDAVRSVYGKLADYVQESGLYTPNLWIENLDPYWDLNGSGVQYKGKGNCSLQVKASQTFGNYAEAKMLSKGAILDLYIREANPSYNSLLPESPTNPKTICMAFSQSNQGCIPIYRKAQALLEYNR